jgi:hypothetical protein
VLAQGGGPGPDPLRSEVVQQPAGAGRRSRRSGVLRVAVCMGCVGLLIIASQSILFDHLAHAYALGRCPAGTIYCAGDSIRARHFLAWSETAVGIEILIATIVGILMAVRRAAQGVTQLTSRPRDRTLMLVDGRGGELSRTA